MPRQVLKYFIPFLAFLLLSFYGKGEMNSIQLLPGAHFTASKKTQQAHLFQVNKVPVKLKNSIRTKSLNNNSEINFPVIAYEFRKQFHTASVRNYIRTTLFFSHKCCAQQLRGPPVA